MELGQGGLIVITGELKNRIDSLWEIFWTGGLTNPLDVIEQTTIFLTSSGDLRILMVNRTESVQISPLWCLRRK